MIFHGFAASGAHLKFKESFKKHCSLSIFRGFPAPGAHLKFKGSFEK